MQKRRSSSRDEGHGSNSERYLLTYADLITLLLGLFVILYASAQVDNSKYKEYASAINKYFNSDAQPDKSNGVMPGQQGIPQPMFPAGAEKTLDQINQEVTEAMQDLTASGTVALERTPNGLTIRLSEKLLFDSGESEIQQGALRSLDSISAILRGIKQNIIVEGHTDDMPIRSFRYESNWHLSVQRALTVAYYCIRSGMPQTHLTISGYGSERPIASNDEAEGRARNRRVEINIKELPQNIPTDEGYITTEGETWTSDTATASDNR